MSQNCIRIYHGQSGILIAEGPLGWGITPFEGNYYIGRRYLATQAFRFRYLPGFCIYKFLYMALDFAPANEKVIKGLGWMYVLPNPLLPFIAFRVAVAGHHPDLVVERYDGHTGTAVDYSQRRSIP